MAAERAQLFAHIGHAAPLRAIEGTLTDADVDRFIDWCGLIDSYIDLYRHTIAHPASARSAFRLQTQKTLPLVDYLVLPLAV